MVEAVDGDILLNFSIDRIAKEAAKAASTLVVCNHVPTAQEVLGHSRTKWEAVRKKGQKRHRERAAMFRATERQ